VGSASTFWKCPDGFCSDPARDLAAAQYAVADHDSKNKGSGGRGIRESSPNALPLLKLPLHFGIGSVFRLDGGLAFYRFESHVAKRQHGESHAGARRTYAELVVILDPFAVDGDNPNPPQAPTRNGMDQRKKAKDFIDFTCAQIRAAVG
jgi:hypothetical protein